MIRNVITLALGSTALALAGPALAAPGGHAGGNASVNAGANARVNSQGAINANPNAVINSNANSALHTTTPPVNTNTKVNSQGVLHANPNGISHSSSNSALARGAVSSIALPGLTTGLTVNNSSGVSIGTVSKVITGTDGSIRAVVVTSPTGQTMRLLPNTLTISGGVVTTTTGG